MARILLINPEESPPSWPTVPRAVEPLGLLYTAGAFADAQVDVTLRDLQLGYGNSRQIYREVAKHHFSAAGIALATQACLRGALRMARKLKHLCPTMPVFTGGVFATLNAPWLLKSCDALDFVVIGEAEPFVENWVSRKMRWENLPRVLHRCNLETFARCLPVPVLTRPAIRPDRSLTPLVLRRGEYPAVAATRGCGGRCTFCSINSYYGGKWQPRPVKDIAAELKEMDKTFNTRRIHLVDDNLFGHSPGSKAWISDLLRVLVRQKRRFRFKTTCRLDDLDQALIPRLQPAGFTFLKIGIETFCQHTQQHYNKPVNREDAISKLNRLRAENIHVSLGMINFDPYCSPADLKANYEFLQQFPGFWNRYLLRSKLIAYRGTVMEHRLRTDGLALTSVITGTRWTFRNPQTATLYRRFEHLLHTRLLPLERQLYHYQKAVLRQGRTPPGMRQIERILGDCWTGLYEHTLFDTPVNSATRLKLKHAALEVEAYCKEHASSNPGDMQQKGPGTGQ